jgi:hypothetical protein
MFVSVQVVKRNWVKYGTWMFYGAFILTKTKIYFFEKSPEKGLITALKQNSSSSQLWIVCSLRL